MSKKRLSITCNPGNYLLIAARACIALALALLCVACNTDTQQTTVQEQGILKVISRNGPTSYYQDRTGPTGFEYELAKMFADYLQVELEITALHSLEAIFQSLEENQAHLAAAGLTMTTERQKRLDFSTPYFDVTQHVLYRIDRARPKSPSDILNSKILIMADSSHEEIMQQLQNDYPQLSWRAATDVETVDLLDMLAEGEIDYTILDSNEYLANRGFYPRLSIGFDVGSPGQLAWALPGKGAAPGLSEDLAAFFKMIKEDGTLTYLQERFYGHSEQVNRMGSLTFNQAVERRLPKYQELIQTVASEYELDWRMLAAISYQESHWNPKARSPTGVRGMMMLTLPTAKEMGIKNRLDAEQSLRGGSRYFNKLLQRVPARITEPDRTWFALAAYNVGMGHLEDARKITQSQGGDPTKWADVKERLPLLSRKRWYQTTKYGYARGNEPVTYVQNIRHYYNLLNWSELAKNRTSPPQEVEQYLPETLREDIRAF